MFKWLKRSNLKRITVLRLPAYYMFHNCFPLNIIGNENEDITIFTCVSLISNRTTNRSSDFLFSVSLPGGKHILDHLRGPDGHRFDLGQAHVQGFVFLQRRLRGRRTDTVMSIIGTMANPELLVNIGLNSNKQMHISKCIRKNIICYYCVSKKSWPILLVTIENGARLLGQVVWQMCRNDKGKSILNLHVIRSNSDHRWFRA